MHGVERQTLRSNTSIRRIFRLVFGEVPDLEFSTLPGGDAAIVVSEWLWIFPSGLEDRWIVRCVVPQDGWFQKFDCLARLDGREIEKKNMVDAVVYLYSLESHRRVHAAIDSDARLAHLAHA